MLCEAANCTGELQPDKLKPVPLTATFETATSAFPVFVNVTFCETVLPAVTVPKLKLEGPTEIASFALATSPVTGSAAVTAAVFVNTETDPVNVPAAFGLNCTVSVLLVPGFSSVEPEKPLMLKPAPLATTPVTVRAASPVFESCKVWELCTPTIAEEKLTLEGVTSSRDVSTKAGVLPIIGDVAQPTEKGIIATAIASRRTSCQLTRRLPASANRRDHPTCFTHISGHSQFQPGISL